MPDDSAHRDQGVRSNRGPLLNHGPAADKGTRTDLHISIQDGPCGDVAVITDLDSVLQKALAIQNAVSSHRSPRLHNSSRHYDGSLAQRGPGRDVGQRGKYDGEPCPKGNGPLVSSLAGDGSFDLADCHQHIAAFFEQTLQIFVCSDDRVPENSFANFVGFPHQPQNTVFSLRLQQPDAGQGMPTRPQDQDGTFSFQSLGPRQVLLGRLRIRCARFSVVCKSMLGKC